jgi:predicted aspartyl protease
MKLKTTFAALFLSLLVSLPGDTLQQEYRTFTGSNGKEIEAVLIDKADNKVTLLLKNGKRTTFPAEKLSASDQDYVSSWNRDKAVFLRECRGLTVRQLLELRGYESFKYELKSNSIIIPGKMNGVEAKFLVDTGAYKSLLHLDGARRTNCKIGPMTEKVYGVAGETEAAWTDVDSLTFGESAFKNLRILAADMAEDLTEAEKKLSQTEDMLLGADLLEQLEAVIDYKERRIFFRPDLSDQNTVDAETDEDLSFRIFKLKDGSTLRGKITTKNANVVTLALVNGTTQQYPLSRFSPEDGQYIFKWSEEGAFFLQHCRSLTIEELLELRSYQSSQYKRRGNHITVDGTLNDHDVVWLIDTGADSSLLHLHWAKEYGCEVGPMDKEVRGIGGKAPAAATKIDKITLGDAVLTNRRLLATDLTRDADDKELDYVGLFGADYMRELEAVITYRENRIFLKPTK